MRRCQQCGNEFGILRHVFRRGEFCSGQCSTAYRQDESSKQNLEKQDCIDQRVNAVTQDKLGRKTLPPLVVKLQDGSSEIPVYFIGAEIPEFRIAQLVGPGHALFGVQVPWPIAWRRAAQNNDRSAFPTLEQIAAPYVAAVNAHLRAPSCVLAGYSFAGILAFESAHQLLARGTKVEMVILLDLQTEYPPAHQVLWRKLRKDWKRRPKGWVAENSRSIGSRIRSSWPIVRWTLVKEMRALGRHFANTVLRDPGHLTAKIDEQGERLRYRLIERLWLTAGVPYRLRSLDCHGVLFRADPESERPARALDRTLGWKDLFSKGLEIIAVPGDHITMIRQKPHNLVLAEELKKLFGRFKPKSKSNDRPVRLKRSAVAAR